MPTAYIRSGTLIYSVCPAVCSIHIPCFTLQQGMWGIMLSGYFCFLCSKLTYTDHFSFVGLSICFFWSANLSLFVHLPLFVCPSAFLCLSICLCLSVHLPLSICLNLSVHLPLSISLPLSVHLSLFICPSAFVCLTICLSHCFTRQLTFLETLYNG